MIWVTLPIGAVAPSGPGLMRGGVFWTGRIALANAAAPRNRCRLALWQREWGSGFPVVWIESTGLPD